MVGGVGSASPLIEFNPSDPEDLTEATVKARLQIAAIKTEQDMQMLQMRELTRLIEPHKGGNIDTRA